MTEATDKSLAFYQDRIGKYVAFLGEMGDEALAFYQDQGLKGKELFLAMQGEYLALQETVNTGLKKEGDLRKANIELMRSRRRRTGRPRREHSFRIWLPTPWAAIQVLSNSLLIGRGNAGSPAQTSRGMRGP